MWSVDGEPVQQLSEVSFYCTGLLWHPSATGRAQGDVFVVGCTDGSFRLISRQGRVEKVEATRPLWRAFSPDGRSPAGREGICRRSSAKVAPEWRIGGCKFNWPRRSTVRRRRSTVRRLKSGRPVYRGLPSLPVDCSRRFITVYR